MPTEEKLTVTEQERRIRIAAQYRSKVLLGRLRKVEPEVRNAKMQAFWRDYDAAKAQRAQERKLNRLRPRYPSLSDEELIERDKENTREARRIYRLTRKYGITAVEWEELLAAQGERCAICEKRFTGTYRTFVDHCHRTSRVRGLLCSNCNTMIGMAYENPETLIAAVKYLAGE